MITFCEQAAEGYIRADVHRQCKHSSGLAHEVLLVALIIIRSQLAELTAVPLIA